MGEAIANYLAAVGIRAQHPHHGARRLPHGVAREEAQGRGLRRPQGASGNAATRLEPFGHQERRLRLRRAARGARTSSERQARELDRKKREELLHQIQRILHDKKIFAPIWENGFIRGVGPRVEEPALALIPAFPYSAPYEDVRLKP